MKKMLLILAMGMLNCLTAVAQPYHYNRDAYTSEWTRIDSLVDRAGLPKSALKAVDLLYKKATAEDNPAQQIKCLVYRMRYMAMTEDVERNHNLFYYEKAYQKASFPLKAILASMLGDAYASFYQPYRDANAFTDESSSDPQFWTKAQRIDKARMYYEASLANEESQQILLSDFDEIRNIGEHNDGLWTTLYDLLMERYIIFEKTQLRNSYNTKKLNTELVFGSRSDFLKLDLETLELGESFHVLKAYQDWMVFHKRKSNKGALVQDDISRLKHARQYSKSYRKRELYQQALEKMLKAEDSFYRTEIQFQIAKYIFDVSYEYKVSYEETEDSRKWLRKEALAICNDAIEKFPYSLGAEQCSWLRTQIEEKELNFECAEVQYPKEGFLAKLTYRNVPEAHFRLLKIPVSFEINYNQKRENGIQKLLKLEVLKTFDLKLPDDGDYFTHSTELRMEGLESGRYVIMASASKSFASQDVFIVKEFKVSQLAVLSNNDMGGEAFVVNRNTGLPLKDVAMHLYEDYRNAAKTPIKILHTDAEGYLSYSADNYRRTKAYWVYGTDTLDTDNRIYSYHSKTKTKKKPKALLFTDRSIYRPGQQLYFKAIALWNFGKGKTELLQHKTVKLSFYDVNNQLVEEKEMKTNEFGSVNGSFLIPDNGLTGRMSIRIDHGGFRKNFSVEAYKRPKFELSFDPVKKSFRPGDQVAVSGKAEALAGSVLDGAAYRYTVVRSVGFPFGCYYWRPYFHEEEEIASGKGVLDSEGKFEIEFDALEMDGMGENEQPEYHYKLVVDVTDINGETQSDETMVNVGVVSMRANINVPAMIDRNHKIDWKISATNLNNSPITTNGRIMIQRLKPLKEYQRDRKWSLPDEYVMSQEDYKTYFPYDPYRDEHKPQNRAVEATVYGAAYDTKKSDSFYRLKTDWEVGDYRVRFSALDPYGKEFKKDYYFKLIDSKKGNIPAQEALCHFTDAKEIKPGETAEFYFGNSFRENHLLFRMEKDGEIYKSNWLRGGKFLKNQFHAEKEHRGNVSYQISGVYKNRFYQKRQTIYIPWADKNLELSYSTFRDKLLPGAKEQWEVKITGAEGERVETELLLSMYDASLDALKTHDWNKFVYPTSGAKRQLNAVGFGTAFGRSFSPASNYSFKERNLGSLKTFDKQYGYGYFRSNRLASSMGSVELAEVQLDSFDSESDDAISVRGARSEKTVYFVDGVETESAWANTNTDTKEKPVQIRKNLKETVFFYPDLKTDADGNIVFSFTMNESLTRWKLMGYGHSKEMQQVYTEKEVVTQKQLMVQPNPPRFLRESDEMVFTTKLSNLSEDALHGSIRLEWLDAFTMKKLEGNWNESSSQNFAVDSKRNVKKSWTVRVPDEWTRPIVYRLVAESDRYSDGEEAAIPVLSKRILLTESVPVYIKGKQKQKASIPNLKNFNSKTGKHHRLTLELTENPAWYALQAMPYLMEYPHECSEQLFSRFYANSLAENLMESKPNVQRVFENWKNTDALQSALHKNQELKNILLKETPWVMAAEDEALQKKRLGLLFDFNTMKNSRARSLRKLLANQLSDGSFPWFKGGKGSVYITRHIVEGFGHLKQMGVQWDSKVDNMLQKAIAYMDAQALASYRKIEQRVAEKKTRWKAQHLNQSWVHYMYTRSYYIESHPLQAEHKKVYDYFASQSDRYWAKFNPYLMGMIGMTMHRDHKDAEVKKIVASLKEKAIHNELGVFWKQKGWYWYQLPIEQQSLLIEFMAEQGENDLVEEAKRWLLSQKRTQHWSTTKGTASAVYALLMTGEDWLEEGEALKVELGGKPVAQNGTKEAGSGYQKIVWEKEAIQNEMGDISIENPNNVPAWAALHWQFFEDRAAVKASDKGPLSLQKKVYVERQTAKGVVMLLLKENEEVQIGDKLLIRLEISNDQEMSYVHLKDGRASALEPIEVMSRYKWNNGIGFYQSIDDAAMHFFIDRMPKGKYVFEYELRVTHEGIYTGGIAEATCMYAPEFSGHSEGRQLKVKP